MDPEAAAGRNAVRQELWEQSVAAVTAAAGLNGRIRAAVRRAQTLEATALRLRTSARAETMRLRSARARRSRIPPLEPVRGLIGFTVEGLIEGLPVRARWANGRLRCDPSLYQRAMLLVDMGEELIYTDPPRRFHAALDGRPVAIALTLLRACDRVTAFQVDLPEASGALSL